MIASVKPIYPSRRQQMAYAMKVAKAREMMAAFAAGRYPQDPCIKCRYRGMCDSDDCAMHNFKLDVNVSPVK